MKEIRQFSISLRNELKYSKQKFNEVKEKLMNQWYSSFDYDGDPREQDFDFSVYQHPEYKYITQECFNGYSKGNTLNILKFFNHINHRPKSFLDIYGGVGYTSLILGKYYPESEIFYHNTDQEQINTFLSLKEKYKIRNVHHIQEPKPCEVVICLEVMEHILEPIKFIQPILTDEVQYYIDGSSFTIDDIGHFPHYINEDEVIDKKSMKRLYFKKIKEFNFHQSFDKNHFIHKRFYNGRPNVFHRG